MSEKNPAAIVGFEQQPTQERTMWNDAALMSTSWRTADMLSKASIIPQQYQGKPGDCLIAIDMANRMGVSPIMVMQSSQVVYGNFTWRGSACKALIDGCGKFKNSQYIMVGRQGAMSWGCKMVAVRTRTGETVTGPTVTMQMAADEGWLNKNGSKWKTMPEIMLRYRAASFFAKTECPEVLMGFQTVEEQIDIADSGSSASVEQYFDMSNVAPEKTEPERKAETAEQPQENQVRIGDL